MASTVLGVGTGVFLIAVVWVLALLFGMMLLRASGSAKLGVVPVLLLALIITLALVFFPRSSETTSSFKEMEELEWNNKGMEKKIEHTLKNLSQIVDSFFIGRYVLLSVVSAVFLVALFMLLPHHFLEPVYAKPLRKH